MDRTTSVAGGAPLPGLTPQPEGEEARGHTPQGEEESPRALANSSRDGTPFASAARAAGGGASPSADVGVLKVVRASTRFQIDLYERKDATDDERARVHALRKSLDDFLSLATTARNVGMRANVRADSDALDAQLAEAGAMPRKPEWTRLYSYPRMTAAVPALSSNVAATLQRDVDRKWSQERYEVLVRQTKSAPHYRVGGAVPIPRAAVKLEARGDGARVSFALFSTRADRERRVALDLVPRDDRQREQLRELCAGTTWQVGQVMLERDRRRMSRFYVRIAYTRLVPRRTGGIAAAINRGMRCFLAMVAGDEAWVYDGEDIEAYLKQIQRRRRQYQYASKASARWGHGRTRTIRPIEHLSGMAARWRQTRNQVIARRAAEWLASRGVDRLYIEDFEGIRNGEPETTPGGRWIWERIQEWPYFDLCSRLVSCCEELGIVAHVVPAKYISQTCPSCEKQDASLRQLAKWRLKCSCGFSRHLDVAAAMNVRARGEAMRSGASSDSAKLRDARESKKSAARKAARNRAKGGGSGEMRGAR